MLRIIAVLGMLILTAGTANAQYAGITPCASKSLSVTAASGNVLLSSCGQTVILYNTTSQEAYYNWGSASTTAATTTGNYIPGGGFVVLNLPAGTYLAGITPTSTTTFKVVQGAAKP